MRVAVMQPYLFPYLGYFHLLAAADHFVFYDDVQFIQQGWINRNRLAHAAFAVPLQRAPHTALIRQRLVDAGRYPHVRRKLLRGFEQHYGRAPYYTTTRATLGAVLDTPTTHIADLAAASITAVAALLGLSTTFGRASVVDYDRSTPGSARLLALLQALGATTYVNPAGGGHLYHAADFAACGIELQLLSSTLDVDDTTAGWGLSVLHPLAHYGAITCRQRVLHDYQLEKSITHARS